MSSANGYSDHETGAAGSGRIGSAEGKSVPPTPLDRRGEAVSLLLFFLTLATAAGLRFLAGYLGSTLTYGLSWHFFIGSLPCLWAFFQFRTFRTAWELKRREEALRERLGDDLVELINRADERIKEDIVATVEEKFERRLAEEMGKLRTDMAEMKADIVRWMFIFWVGQIGVLVGILFTFFR